MATETKSTEAQETAAERGHRKTRRGYVLSDKMEKTIVVEVEARCSLNMKDGRIC